MSRASAFLLALAALSLSAIAADAAPISLIVRPEHFAFAPCDVSVQVRIRPVASDRAVWIVVEGPDYSGSSAWTIPGDEAPPLSHPVLFRDLPAGEYMINAAIGTSDHVRASATATLTLLGRE